MPLREYIFRLTPISKQKFDTSKAEQKIDRKLANSFAFVKQCKCNPFLKLYLACLPDEKLNDLNILYVIELDGLFYETYISINGPLNNPDGDDPPPPPPRNQSIIRPPVQDTYICMRNEYLDGARNNNHYYPVVAIMDTGIDLRYFDTDCCCPKYPLNYYENPCCLGVTSNCGCSNDAKCRCNNHHDCECNNKCHCNDCCNCKKEKGHENHVFGYSFINEVPFIHQPNNPFDDDKSHKHGTRIAKIIAERTENKVRIMPLKTANYKGEHTFFDIFCAFEYIFSYNRNNIAQNRVRIINASWGFESNVENMILKEYIETIENYGILFVTSAGNINIEIGRGHGERHYYPALYSEANNLVYTVTSVSIDQGRLSVTNGMSQRYVDIGVVGDENGGYNDPLGSFGPIIGTSYSAAHFTGFVANQMLNNNFDVYNFSETDGIYAALAGNLVAGIRPEGEIPQTIAS